MKKALAILMTIALVSTAAFADVGKTVTPAPTVTLGVTASVETDLFKANSITTTAPGKSAVATDGASFKSEPYGLGTNPLMFTKDWVNLDWSQMSIKAEGKYDAFRAADDDAKCTGFYVTTTWKNFFGFSVVHEYGVNDKNDSTVQTNSPVMNKNNTNKVTVKTSANGMTFWSEYNADTIFGLANLATAGQAVEGVFDGFKSIGFEYDDASQFYAKLVLKNTAANTLPVDASAASVAPASPAAVDTAIIEARKMFDMWTVRINDKSENKIRVQNLGSDCKIGDVNAWVVGKDYLIQNTSGKIGMNFFNTITPIFNLTVKLNALAPMAYNGNTPTTAPTIADWLKGDNLVFGASYLITDIGTIDAGVKVSNDYSINNGGTEGPTLLLAKAAAVPVASVASFAASGANTAVAWGNGFWLGAKLDKKLLGDAANKSIYAGIDMQLGNYVDYLATTKAWVANTDPNKSTVISAGNVSKTNINLETKMVLVGDGTAAGSLTVNAGLLATLVGGATYNTVFSPAVAGTTVTEANFKTIEVDPLNVTGNNNWVSASYTEANFMNRFYAGNNKDITSPFQLQARVDYVVSPVIKNVYIKDSYKALAGALSSTAVSGGRAIYGFYDTNTVTVGTKLFATKKADLSLSMNYNMYLGLPTAGDLYSTNATDGQKKVVDQNREVAFNSGSFSPFNLHIAYTYTY